MNDKLEKYFSMNLENASKEELEQAILEMFRILPGAEQQEVLDFINYKLEQQNNK